MSSDPRPDGVVATIHPMTWSEVNSAGIRAHAAGRAEEATAWFAVARQLRPDHIPTLCNHGMALCRVAKHADALEAFDGALSINPICSSAHHGRGVALAVLQDHDTALSAFRRAVFHQPDRWTSWVSIAEITPYEDERIGAVFERAKALERLCLAGDASSDLLLACGHALIDAHRFQDAVTFAAEHITRFANPGSAHDLLSRATYRQGNFKAAFEHKKRSLFSMNQRNGSQIDAACNFKPQNARVALQEVLQHLSEQGVQGFPIAGTFLGLHRNGGPLPHDRDVDIGVIRSGARSPDIAGILRRWDRVVLPPVAREGDPYIGFLYQGVGVDIFIHDIDHGHIKWRFSDLEGDICWRAKLDPLAGEKPYDTQDVISSAANQYLQQVYGVGWETEDTYFVSAVSSPALFGASKFARAFFAVSKAMTLLNSGENARADAVLSQSPIPIPDEDEPEREFGVKSSTQN